MQRVLAMMVLIMLTNASCVVAADVTITHLTYTSSGEGYQNFLREMVEKFEQLHPDIKIELIVGLQDKFQTMMAGGVAPDVIDLPDFDYLGPLGQLVDIKPLLQKDGLLQVYNPKIIEKMTNPNGAIYKMPLEIGVYLTWFNRDLFDETGLHTPDTMGSGWNWDALWTSSKKTTVDRDGNGIPETFGFDRAWGPGWRFFVYQAGGAFYDYDDKMQPIRSLWNSPQVVQAIQFNERFFREGVTPRFYPGVTKEADYFFYTFGKTAISIQDGLYVLSYLKNVPFSWDMALLPAGPAGPIGVEGVAQPQILSSTKHLQETWEWVKFYCATKENAERFAELTGRLPGLIKAQPSFVTINNLTSKNWRAIMEQTNYQPSITSTYPLPNELSPRKIDLYPVWRGDIAAAARLQAIYEQTTAYIAEMRKKREGY